MANATEWEPGADQTLVRAMIELFKGTSSTSMILANSGTFTFITEPYLYFAEGQWITLIDNANSDNWMAGQVTSYNPISGSTVFVSKVSHGSGTIADWLVYISGAWIDNSWNGGTVTNPVQINSTLGVTGISTVARVIASAPITSTAGDINLNTTTTLADANATITAAQLFGGTLVIEPTAARILTLPTAAQIIAYLTGYAVGSKFEFVIVNSTLQTVTLAPGSGIVQLGKTIIQDGSAVFKVTVDSASTVSVINESTSIAVSRSGAISTSTVQTSTVDITLTNTSPRLNSISMSVEGNSVILPSALTVLISSPTFVIFNAGYYPFGIKDASGALIAAVEANGEIVLSLAANGTVAGTWAYSGTNLKGGLITKSSLLSTAYVADAVYNTYLAFSNTESIHFTKISGGGLAVFMIDHATKTFSSPSTISLTAGTIPAGVFKIDATSFIIFYYDSNIMYAVVVVLLTGTLVVGLASNTGVIGGITTETGYKAPKIAQLDTNLFLLSYVTGTGAGVTAVRACQVSSITTVTWGAAANINAAADNFSGSTVTLALTTLTALVHYKLQAAPYNAKAVVISVTNANPPVCTVGTPVTVMASTEGREISCALLSATECIALSDNNVAGSLSAKSLTIAGAVITVNAATILDTGFGTQFMYDIDLATRFTPHVFKISSSSFLWWFIDSASNSRMAIATVAAGVITDGNQIKGSICSAAVGTSGEGRMLAMSTTELLSVTMQYGTSGDKVDYFLVPHKIAGNTITVGKLTKLENIIAGTGSIAFMAAKLSNGVYAVANAATSLFSMDSGIELFKTDGINVLRLGVLDKYASGLRSSDQPRALGNCGSNLITLAATHDITEPATVKQLRVTSILTKG